MPSDRHYGDTRLWVENLGNDIRCAEINLGADPPETEDALFNCQQAVEKTLKAFLVWHDAPFRKVHDLGMLRTQAEAIDLHLKPC